jgi:hypothetical protein
MRDIFSLVTLTAAAFSCTIFLTTLSNGTPLELRLNHEATTARRVSDNGCHLHSPLLAGGRDRVDVLAHLGSV